MGSIQSLMGMLPTIGPFAGLQKAADKVDEKQIDRVEAIINSMTLHEREHHEVINGSRAQADRARLGNQRAGSESICSANTRRCGRCSSRWGSRALRGGWPG